MSIGVIWLIAAIIFAIVAFFAALELKKFHEIQKLMRRDKLLELELELARIQPPELGRSQLLKLARSQLPEQSEEKED